MPRTHTEETWLKSARASLLQGDLASTRAAVASALAEHPQSRELRRMQAGVHLRDGRAEVAEHLLRELLAEDAHDTASAFAIAELLKNRCRSGSAAAIIRGCFAGTHNCSDAVLAINAIELLDGCGRKHDAFAIARSAIAANPDDPRLHAYAGMLAVQLGEFDNARKHYLFALERDARAVEWHVPIGLSSTLRYDAPGHPDLAFFRRGLKRDDLSALARAELHFALGKASDDFGDYAGAAQHFRKGNAIRKGTANWSRKAWRRAIEARLGAKPSIVESSPIDGFTPIFVVGMPRSGTTLLAQLLSRYPRVRNLGELPTLARLAQDTTLGEKSNRAAVQNAATSYAREARQDEASTSHWFIDKQPLNFRYVDLALAMFPDAKIIHCVRSERDTALSLWMQCFLEDVQGYSYEFDDIALVMGDCDRLMKHWNQRHSRSIKTVLYEELVSMPNRLVEILAEWIGLSPRTVDATTVEPNSSLSTASLWQARQPVYSTSVGRWKHFMQQLPELLQFKDS